MHPPYIFSVPSFSVDGKMNLCHQHDFSDCTCSRERNISTVKNSIKQLKHNRLSPAMLISHKQINSAQKAFWLQRPPERKGGRNREKGTCETLSNFTDVCVARTPHWQGNFTILFSQQVSQCRDPLTGNTHNDISQKGKLCCSHYMKYKARAVHRLD